MKLVAAILFLLWPLILARTDELVVVKREERRSLVSTENGDISSVGVGDHLLHYFTLDPNSLFLPAILHTHMLFYVHTGSGKLRWREEDGDEVKTADLKRGDIGSLAGGCVFFIHSNLDTDSDRQKLRIYAIFPNSHQYLQESGGPYSSIRDTIVGFDNKILQAAFKVPAEKIDELVNGVRPPPIIHAISPPKKKNAADIFQVVNKKKKKKKSHDSELFNLLEGDKDFENCNGWSTTATNRKVGALEDVGFFMVNLTQGSMMGPHWNPKATEIAVVLQGRGMVRVGSRNVSYEVNEGDTFVVPRFHSMAQMAFNNDTFVFMGFSTSPTQNHPQFLAGEASVFRALDKDVLAVAFNVTNTTMDQLLQAQRDSVILGCLSCAEEEYKIVEEERAAERAREEEERERAAEKAREEEREREEEKEREEERERAAEKAREEEEESARREQEEAARQEEERQEEIERQEEEAAAAAKKREEEEEKKRQEEEAKKKEEEEERKRQEEEAKKEEEVEEEKKRQEERRRQEEQEEERRRQEEQEEEERRRQEEQEEERRRQEEQEEGEEEVARREEEERRRREEEEEEEEGGGGRPEGRGGSRKILKLKESVF